MKYRIIANHPTLKYVNLVVLDKELGETITDIINAGFVIESVSQTDANLS